MFCTWISMSIPARDMTRAMGKLNSGIPQVPPATSTFGNDAIAKRRDLPIWTLRNEIVTSISQNQVTLVTGDTGSGKTTQVPQFILEHFSDQRLPCRIVCTQPRRLAAVAVAERVAYERDEKARTSCNRARPNWCTIMHILFTSLVGPFLEKGIFVAFRFRPLIKILRFCRRHFLLKAINLLWSLLAQFFNTWYVEEVVHTPFFSHNFWVDWAIEVVHPFMEN